MRKVISMFCANIETTNAFNLSGTFFFICLPFALSSVSGQERYWQVASRDRHCPTIWVDSFPALKQKKKKRQSRPRRITKELVDYENRISTYFFFFFKLIFPFYFSFSSFAQVVLGFYFLPMLRVRSTPVKITRVDTKNKNWHTVGGPSSSTSSHVFNLS